MRKVGVLQKYILQIASTSLHDRLSRFRLRQEMFPRIDLNFLDEIFWKKMCMADFCVRVYTLSVPCLVLSYYLFLNKKFNIFSICSQNTSCLNLNLDSLPCKEVDAICSIYFCRTPTVRTNSPFLIDQQFYWVRLLVDLSKELLCAAV